jgi:hypothetical protein
MAEMLIGVLQTSHGKGSNTSVPQGGRAGVSSREHNGAAILEEP